MKKILALVLFLLFSLSIVHAQGNGGNGNGNGQGNGNGYAWGNGGGFNGLVTWLENGGQIPQVISLAAIYKARDWGQQSFGFNYGHMIAKYAQGQLTVTYISTAPPTLIFSVRIGGQAVVVILDNI
jgi:hypothetical protein